MMIQGHEISMSGVIEYLWTGVHEYASNSNSYKIIQEYVNNSVSGFIFMSQITMTISGKYS